MATGKRPPSGIPGARRKRPAPTIELTATEVAAAPEAAAEMPPEPPKAAADPPPPGGVTWLPPEMPWAAAAAGALGCAAVLLVLLLIWLLLPRGEAVATLTPRLASIETQLRDLAAKPSPPSIDPQALDGLSARLAKLETALAAPRPVSTDPALAERMTALEKSIKPLSDSVAALARRADETDAAFRNVRGRADTIAAAVTELQNVARAGSTDHGEIAKLAERLAAVEKADRAVADQLARNTANDRPVRLAVAAAALRAAVDRGEPFATELAAIKPLTGDAQAIAAIEPFAGSGVPGAATLGRELLVIVPVMHRAAGTATRDSGLLDRLQANAEKLVRIRPVDALSGEEPAAVLSRVEVKAAHADIAGALAELAKLPASVRAPALAWVAKAEARDRAVEASRRLFTDAIAALKTNP